ncbi:MAG TPA: ring-cleaving dioxygenase [Thermomicrobiaceae bacterium]|nr:ring-cleaving dioxygenase [Thermomicrobiaceae bacterium]
MAPELGGLHHVTAVTAHAAENLRFYTEVLGLRLVKKTVNQDDVSAYHLFYGDELGHAGTEVTFFDWAMAAPNRAGHGEVSAVGLRVPDRAALDWWAARFDALGVPHGEIAERDGRGVLAFTDPEGQRLELVDEIGAVIPGGVPWARSSVPSGVGIRGLGTAKLTVARPEPTARVLTEVLGFRQTAELPADDGAAGGTTVYEVGPGGPGATVLVEVRPDLARARQGRGGVHHIAFRTPTFEEHEAWQRHIAAAGLGVTPIIDRYYFRSIYFREPGGVLFEIATDGPGFATDEDAARLGESLALPPFLEPHRARIEAGLRPLPTADVAAGDEL